MRVKMTSRERLVRTLDKKETDHLPCCFMSFTSLRQRCGENMFELCKAELAMGLDSMLFFPTAPRHRRSEHPDLRGLPVRFAPQVAVRQWREDLPNGEARLYRKYTTPAGELSTGVQLSDDWPYGDHLPFIGDYLIPRYLKPLIAEPGELEALQFLLASPQAEDIAGFAEESGRARAFANEHRVMLAGGWGVGMDMAFWLGGMQEMILAAVKQPGFVAELLQIIHRWNLERMRVILSAPIDLFIRRAWYEGCDFITPGFFHTTILPLLKAEVDLAHERGTRFGYICSSGLIPMLVNHLEAGFDVLIGIDPVQGTYTDMERIKAKMGGRACLWGGVSGAVTVEMGTEADVRTAVDLAIRSLGPQCFILSPVDNITVDSPFTWQNIEILLDEWRRHW